AVAHLRFALHANERAVGAAEIGEVELSALGSEAAVQSRDVSIFGEEDVATLAAEVDPGVGDRVGVAGGVAADDERDPADVVLRWAAEALDAVSGGRHRGERFIAEDLLADAEDLAEVERDGLVAAELFVDAVERAVVMDEELAAARGEGRVARGEV